MNFLLADKTGTLTQAEKDAIQTIIDDIFRGGANSFETAVV